MSILGKFRDSIGSGIPEGSWILENGLSKDGMFILL
jgi:hypothetical protein